MNIIISITLSILALISGLYALSPFDTNKKSTKEETVLEKIGITNPVEVKKNLYSRLISWAVFVLSRASLMAVYFIK